MVRDHGLPHSILSCKFSCMLNRFDRVEQEMKERLKVKKRKVYIHIYVYIYIRKIRESVKIIRETIIFDIRGNGMLSLFSTRGPYFSVTIKMFLVKDRNDTRSGGRSTDSRARLPISLILIHLRFGPCRPLSPFFFSPGMLPPPLLLLLLLFILLLFFFLERTSTFFYASLHRVLDSLLSSLIPILLLFLPLLLFFRISIFFFQLLLRLLYYRSLSLSLSLSDMFRDSKRERHPLCI